jgi:hypothetical protein
MAITYEPIATTTLGSAQSTITFTSFSGYTDLVLIANLAFSSADYIRLIFNNETSTTNYYGTWLQGDTSGGRYNSSIYWIGGATQLNTTIGNNLAIINILNYSNSNTQKSVLARYNKAGSALGIQVGSWNNTAAITQIDVVGATGSNFATGSIFTLYGIKAA